VDSVALNHVPDESAGFDPVSLHGEANMILNDSQPDRTNTIADSAAKRFPTAIGLGILLLTQFATQAWAAPAGPPLFKDPIVGTWNVLVDITNCETGDVTMPGNQALALFNADGTRHETNASNPALRTPAYGNWHRVGKDAYQFTFKFFRFAATGAHIGSTIVRHDHVLLADGWSYYSEGTAEFFDANNNSQFIACSTATATRFQ
jgi:hypothetical protein